MAGLSRRRFLAGSAAAVGTAMATTPTPASAATLSGSAATVVDDRLVVSALVDRSDTVRLRAWPAADPTAVVVSSAVTANAALTAQVSVPIDRRMWRWQAVTSTGSQTAVGNVPARPRTATAFTFAFGCCALYTGEPLPTLDQVARSSAAFLAFIGDLGYINGFGEQTYERYVGEFRRWVGGQPEMRAIAAKMPFYFVGDDHDYGRDDCIGIGGTNGANPEAIRAYDDVLPGTTLQGGVTYRRWSQRGVDFFLLDNRRYASTSTKLGSAQREWLVQGLATSSARLKVVLAPSTPTWYWPKADVEALVGASSSGMVLVCSGDKHANAHIELGPRTHEMLCGPLSNPKKHLTPQRPYRIAWSEGGIGGRSVSDSVGFVDVADTSVTLRWTKGDGSTLHRAVLPLSG